MSVHPQSGPRRPVMHAVRHDVATITAPHVRSVRARPDDNGPMEDHHDHALGRAGEHAAARWLIRRGWRVVATRWRGGGGEIDIVAERRGVLAACEVKTRTRADALIDPLRPGQRQRLAHAALAYVGRDPALSRHVIRPDLITVRPGFVGWRISRVEDVTPDRYRGGIDWLP